MLKSKYLYACLAASLFLSVPLIAEAKIVANGISLNGISLNGISLNGISLNGISLNGISLNGTSLNGIDLNTNQITPAATNGTVRLEGGQLVIQTAPIAQ